MAAGVEVVPDSRASEAAYIACSLADRLGEGILQIALGWLAAAEGGAGAAAAVLGAASVPRVVFLLLGGALGDRIGLFKAASVTLLARFIVVGALAAAMTVGKAHGIAPLVAVAIALGIVDSLHMPALSGVIAHVAPEARRVSMQGMLNAGNEAAELIAGPLAGALLGVGLAGVPLTSSGLLLVALALLLVLARRSGTSKMVGGETGLIGGIRQAARLVRSNPAVWPAFPILTVVNFLSTAPLLAGLPSLSVLRGWDAPQYGLVTGGFAAGTLVGGLLLSRVGEMVPRRLWVSTALLVPIGASMAGLAATTSVAVAVCLAALAGGVTGLSAGLLIGHVQASTPSEYMGRVMSMVQLAVFASVPASFAVYGLLSRTWDAAFLGVWSGLLVAAFGALTLLVLRNRPAPRGAR